jgi:hypothetical protein
MERDVKETLESIESALREMKEDVQVVQSLFDAAKRFLEQVPLKTELCHYFDEALCNTAFAVRMEIPSDPWQLFFEVSKLGPFSRRYWARKTWILTRRYSTAPPTAAWKRNVRHANVLATDLGVRVLTEEELREPLPEAKGFWIPIHPRETVEQLMFCLDGSRLNAGGDLCLPWT